MTTRLAIVALVFASLLVWTHARPRADGSRPFDFAVAVPLTFGEWVGRDAPPLDPETARVLAATQYVHRFYGYRGAPIGDGQPRIADVEVDLAYYVEPQAGGAMHSPLNCLPGNGWQVIDARPAAIRYAGGTVGARHLVVARGADRVAMAYWFQNRGAIAGDEYRQRLQFLTNGLHGRPVDAAVVRVMALDTRDGRDAIRRFSRGLAAVLLERFR
jgi:EpsI family protein